MPRLFMTNEPASPETVRAHEDVGEGVVLLTVSSALVVSTSSGFGISDRVVGAARRGECGCDGMTVE